MSQIGTADTVLRIDGWPADGTPMAFDELTKPLREAINAAYKLERSDLKALPWTGPNIGRPERATCLDAADTLRSLSYHEERGRDPMDVILMLALQLGIEQGRRIYKNSDSFELIALQRLSIKGVRTQLEQLDDPKAKELALRLCTIELDMPISKTQRRVEAAMDEQNV